MQDVVLSKTSTGWNSTYISAKQMMAAIITFSNSAQQTRNKIIPYPSLVCESPMLNTWPVGFWSITWKDTDRAPLGGVILITPCSAQGPASAVGRYVHVTSAVFPGRADICPEFRLMQ